VSTNATIRRSLYDTLNDGLTGVNVYEYPVDNVQPPCVVITNLESEITTFDGGRTVGATVLVLESHNVTDQMARVDDLVDPNVTGSVPDLIADQADLSLGVRTIGTIGLYEYAGVAYYGSAVVLELID
jgi:hypothetical protein